MEIAAAVQDLVAQIQIAATYAFVVGLLGGLAYILLPAIRLASLGRPERQRYEKADQAVARRVFRY